MNDRMEGVLEISARSNERAVELVEKLYEVARPEAVFGEPLVVGDQTVITASEVVVGLGYGFGIGGGSGPGDLDEPTNPVVEEEEDLEDMAFDGGGGGGGGGGMSRGRAVAVITVGPGGVQVEPVVDVTKIALAFFTTFGSMLLMLGKMRKASRV